MFRLVCGEDTGAARSHIHDLKAEYRRKHAQVVEVPPAELEDLLNAEQDTTLFGEPIVYITQGLLGYWGKRKKKAAEQIVLLQKNEEVTVIDWEPDKSLYDLKLKSAPFAKEFKPAASLFDIQDLCYPGNRERFIRALRVLEAIHDPFLIFSLLHKRIRLLMLLKTGQPTGTISPYVKTKATSQASRWELSKLAAFYTGLARIDQSVKSSGTPLSLPRSLEVLACYYL
ncbi:MAG: hypothetical protein N2691_03630 [Patescibacteria group bacterium]|nr:hypothetical protein [Patescibacteria group bacterium]